MEDNAWVVQSVAGAFFLLAAVPLIRLARRTGLLPEWVLGITFLLMGISYGFYQAPLIFPSLEATDFPFEPAGRLFYAASVIAVVFFTRRVFRARQFWAGWLCWGCVALIAAGIGISGYYGDWDGTTPLKNPGFWIEWVGELTPFLWIAAEGMAQFLSARKRAELGLCKPAVCNRFLLWCLFGLMQFATLVIYAQMNIEYELEGHFSVLMDSLVGSFELLTVLVIWLAFFPPRIYRRWVDGGAQRTLMAAAR